MNINRILNAIEEYKSDLYGHKPMSEEKRSKARKNRKKKANARKRK